ncbi:hypothetical protein BTO18_02375 [Polaribacter porphyrae]|uniref:Uncharacterized protein n=1 Tax=Polaribacter porphyrae TaxID=1137780 RepID=A0A2S7WKH2_9FLAO|nr:hypothetical protein BTO18_02375 [Polaribacter porphyrae]
MDSWGALTMLIKRQEAAKNRKKKLKFDLDKRKKNLQSNSVNGLEFKKVSESELKEIKSQIKSKSKRDNIKNLTINLLIFLICSLVLYYLVTQIKTNNLT